MSVMGNRLVVPVGIVAVLALASCGPTQKPGGGGTTGEGGAAGNNGGGTFQAGAEVTPASVCARIMSLKDQGCDVASGYELSEAECTEDFRRSLEERGPEAKAANTSLGRCLLDNESCEAVGQCIASITEPHQPGDLRACEDSGTYAPVGVPRAEWNNRRGASARRYSDVATTKEEPIEVCKIPAQMEWLLSLTCDDGSRPFRSFDHAHAARVGNVGPGGKCGSIIDLYEVPCPEGTYKIFIDAYVCPQD
jgi:hypothetical protein